MSVVVTAVVMALVTIATIAIVLGWVVVWSVGWADPLCVWMRLCKQRVSQLLSVRSGLAQHLI